MSAIDGAVEHYDGQGIKKLNVKEWGDLDIYYKPPTAATFKEVHDRAGGTNAGEVSVAVYTLIYMAKDEAGEKLFTLEDKIKLMTRTDLTVLVRVARVISTFATVEEQEEKSSATSD